MLDVKEILAILSSAEYQKEYEKHFDKENVVDVAKNIYDVVDSLSKMPKEDGIASVLLAKLMLEDKNQRF